MKIEKSSVLMVAGFLLMSVFTVGLTNSEVGLAQEDPIEIYDWYDLDEVREDLNADYILENDLDEDTDGYDELASEDANELDDRGKWEEETDYEANDLVEIEYLPDESRSDSPVEAGEVIQVEKYPIGEVIDVINIRTGGSMEWEEEDFDEGKVRVLEDAELTFVSIRHTYELDEPKTYYCTIPHESEGHFEETRHWVETEKEEGETLGWNPIGEYRNDGFNGTFDGNGHEIRDLYIDRPEEPVGLFLTLDEGAEVVDLEIKDVDIEGEAGVGALAARNSGMISDCHSGGEIRAK